MGTFKIIWRCLLFLRRQRRTLANACWFSSVVKVTGNANANTTVSGALDIKILKWLMVSCDIEIKEQSSLLVFCIDVSTEVSMADSNVCFV